MKLKFESKCSLIVIHNKKGSKMKVEDKKETQEKEIDFLFYNSNK